MVNTEQKKNVMVSMPLKMKEAAEKEAARRGLTLSGLIKLQLSNFLPENIGNAISERNKTAANN